MNMNLNIGINASDFHNTRLHPDTIVYHASSSDPIVMTSFEHARNPANYRSLFFSFAYIVTNHVTGEHLLIRDHLGLRPLYYAYTQGRLIFGDNIPDLLKHFPSPPGFLETEVAHLFADVHNYTDNTLYRGIYRVEPGHMVHVMPDGRITKSVFWQLEPQGPTLYYREDREYLLHFKALMQESVRLATDGVDEIAAEFSAGMDSTAIYGTCVDLGLNPTLFMHAAIPGSPDAMIYNDSYERAFFEYFRQAKIHRLYADGFDAIQVFKDYAAWFAGPAPYIFELFTHHIHQAVSTTGHRRLLSGFGGDQGVSEHVPARFILPFLIKNKQFRRAWLESGSGSMMRRLLLLAQCTHPLMNHITHTMRDLKKEIHKQVVSHHPYHRKYFKTLREVEWSMLQGPQSHEIRMRIEYSSVVAKKMGFEYRYPLLYPKLLEFFLSLPIEQKRHQGRGRYLMRRYLSHLMPTVPFEKYEKKEGLSILPATVEMFKAQWEQGAYQDTFQLIHLKNKSKNLSQHKRMIETIQAFMLNEV